MLQANFFQAPDQVIDPFGSFLTSIIDEGDLSYCGHVDCKGEMICTFTTSHIGVHQMGDLTSAILSYIYRVYPHSEDTSILCKVQHTFRLEPNRLEWRVEVGILPESICIEQQWLCPAVA